MEIIKAIENHERIIDILIAEKAAELRANYGLRTPDALQIAIAIENNGTLFITNDKGLEKIKEVEVLVLDNYSK